METKRKITPSATLFAASLLSSFLVVESQQTAHAFPPSKFKAKLISGNATRSHESITQDALAEFRNDIFSVTRATPGIEAAAKEIVEANEDVDKDQTSSALHFDAESLPEGQARLVNIRGTIKVLLSVPSVPKSHSSDVIKITRRLIGEALHSIQDFYSHTNWVELGNSDINYDLGVAGKSLPRLPPDIPTCERCVPCISCAKNVITDELTSGYYGGQDRMKPNRNKCGHGGPFDSSEGYFAIIGGMNKDTLDCMISPHWHLHFRAATLAARASYRFLRELYSDLGPSDTRILLGL